MFNKISSFNIRAEKSDHWNDVFVAQPDALKESLAGKVFLLAEFFAKKNQGEKIFNFITESIEDNYYNDEKLLLKEKVEGLKTENIFEAALAKTSSDLSDFLDKEKIDLNVTNCNLTLGVVYENRIHFSNFGRNKALLLYPQKDKLEVINVETNAFEKEEAGKKDAASAKVTKIFASVISGEVPKNSYFVFSSESLPEYISEKELGMIISKLPPLTAAYQIKNLLEKINLRVPFFGAIIKSASELDKNYKAEDVPASTNASNSVSSLKNIEKNTEELLTSSSVINLGKISKKFKEAIKTQKEKVNKKDKAVDHLNYGRQDLEKEEMEISLSEDLEKKMTEEKSRKKIEVKKEKEKKEEEKKPAKKKVNDDFGIIRTLGAVKKDSNIKDEQFSFKKKGGGIFSKQKFANILTGIKKAFKSFKKASNRKKQLIILVPLLVITLVSSIYVIKSNKKVEEIKENLSQITKEVEKKESVIESKLLYNNREDAFELLEEIKLTINNLELNKHSESGIKLLEKKAREIEDKVNLISRLSESQLVYDFKETDIGNIITLNDKLYAFSDDSLYKMKNGDEPEKIDLASGINKYDSSVYDDIIYSFNNEELISYNPKNDKVTKKSINGYENDNDIEAFSMFSGGRLYLLKPSVNEIDKLSTSNGVKEDWLKEDANLKNAKDIYIDGDVYLLRDDASISKYRSGKKQDYSSAQITTAQAEHNFSKIKAYSNKFYLFNKVDKKLVVINKDDGLLQSQYIFEDLANPQDFAVDLEANVIYLVDQGRVVKYDL